MQDFIDCINGSPLTGTPAAPEGAGHCLGSGVLLSETLAADGGMLQGAAVLELGDGAEVATISRSTTATLAGSNLYSR